MMLTAIYVLLVFFCIGLLQKKLPLDPMLIAIPGVLIVPGSIDILLSVFISILPACVYLALWVIVCQKSTLQIELITRYAAGAGLGGFIGLQILSFQLSTTFFVSALCLLTLLSVVCQSLNISLQRIFTNRLALIFGVALGTAQVTCLSSGRALTGNPISTTQAISSVIWLVTMIGILVGWLALPQAGPLKWDWPILISSLVGLTVGLLVSLKIKVQEFESAILYWVVISMCVSAWLHFWITY